MPSAVGDIAGGLLGSTPSVPNVQTWQPGGVKTADQQYQNLTTNMATNNPYSTYSPQAIATFNSQYNNPYAAGYQTAANTAGAQFGATGTADAAASGNMYASGNTATGAANQLLQMGFDPQSALYQRTLQQLTDSSNANNAAAGTGTSPYGSSVTSNAQGNFNIDWQNQQLQRAVTALGGYNSGIAGAASDYASGNSLGTAGAAATAKSGLAPYEAANDITGNQSAALTQLLSVLGTSGAGGWDTATLSALSSYLGLGANQSNAQAKLDLSNYGNQLDAANASNAGIGQVAGDAAMLALLA